MNPHLFTHTAVHLSGLCYCAAVSLRWLGANRERRWLAVADGLWILGCLLLWIHVAAVWRVIHESSWNAAWEHTARETAAATGVETGAGIWFNFATLALWTADCIIRIEERRHRETSHRNSAALIEVRDGKFNRWRRFVGIYLAFMWFQAAVVFPHSPIRFVGLAATVWLVALAGIVGRRRTR